MLIPLHHVPIKKMQFRNRAMNLWSAGMMKCTRDFKNNRFGKAIVLCGKLFRGELGLLVWRKRVPNLFGIFKCILYFYNLGFHWIPVGGVWASFVKLPEENHLKSWILQLQGSRVITIAGSFCIMWLWVVWVQQYIAIVVQGVYVKLWFAKVGLLMLMRVWA
jgi:hypothetical protein